MDPNATLALFFSALYVADDEANGDSNDAEIDALRSAVNHAADLFEWLRKGGFAPDWSKR